MAGQIRAASSFYSGFIHSVLIPITKFCERFVNYAVRDSKWNSNEYEQRSHSSLFFVAVLRFVMDLNPPETDYKYYEL